MADLEGFMGKDLAAARAITPTSVALSSMAAVDLSRLPEEERRTLLTEHERGILNIIRKAQELHVDVATLQNALRMFAETTKKVADDGNAVTIGHIQTTSIGRTEIMMGNTQHALSGKLSKSQTGERDWTPYYVFAGLLALVLIAALVVQ